MFIAPPQNADHIEVKWFPFRNVKKPKLKPQLLPEAKEIADAQEHRDYRRRNHDRVNGFVRLRASGRRGDQRSVKIQRNAADG